MSLYRYYCRRRPPSPGAVPNEGLLYVRSFDCLQMFDGIKSWGYVEYSRRLNDREISDYELLASENNPIYFE